MVALRCRVPRPQLRDDHLIHAAVAQGAHFRYADRGNRPIDFLGRLWLPSEVALVERVLWVVEQIRRFAMHETTPRAESRLDVEIAGCVLRHTLRKWYGHGETNLPAFDLNVETPSHFSEIHLMHKFFIVGALLGLSLAGFAAAAVYVSPFRIEETRTAAFAEDKIGHSPEQLKIVLSLKGPEAQSSVRYGNLHLDQAVDDRGTDLIPAKDSFNRGDKFEEYSNAFFRKSGLGRNDTPADPEVEIVLGLPKRAATKIAHLRGSFDLAEQGTIKTVTVPDIATPGSKKLDLPAAAGVQITTTVDADKKTSVGMNITGDEDAIESIEVLDSSGKKISNGMSWFLGSGPKHKSLDLESPLDATMKLVVKLAVDRKITKVPFDLKDIALP